MARRKTDYVMTALRASLPGGNNAQSENMKRVLRRLVREAVILSDEKRSGCEADGFVLDLADRIAKELVP